jgi:hypothetical protein
MVLILTVALEGEKSKSNKARVIPKHGESVEKRRCLLSIEQTPPAPGSSTTLLFRVAGMGVAVVTASTAEDEFESTVTTCCFFVK